MDPLKLLQEFVSLPGPSGQEEAIRHAVQRHVQELGLAAEVDAKGNLLVQIGSGNPAILVTAHLDEIAMITRLIGQDGRLMVTALGGLFPWKLGEGPVQILASAGPVDGVLSFGSIHTAHPGSSARRAIASGLDWDMCEVITGWSEPELRRAGVRPGTRVVVHPNRRTLHPIGDLISGYFLDDRADLVSWLLSLEALKDSGANVLFAATAAEEVGGEGALFVMQSKGPFDVCIALELSPIVDDAPIQLSDQPALWVTDSYSTMAASDMDLVAQAAHKTNLDIQYQALSRGGSDASCAANHGLCGRPFTLGLPIDNSHGFEVMHPDSMANLAALTTALIKMLDQTSPASPV